MAFKKYSQAIVSNPSIIPNKSAGARAWAKIRNASKGTKGFDKVASNLLKKYSPDKYLLTHATIVASVDVEKVPGVKTGSKVAYNGGTINRKWDDYYITPETAKYSNCNEDAWDRQTLLNTYHTFIGAENYCFAPDTKVLMSDGTYKAIQDVRVGDKVITHEGNVKPVVYKFERDYAGEVCELYIDKFDEPIVATPNHPFYFIDVESPEANPYEGSKKSSQERYYRDQVTSHLRDGDSNLGGRLSGLKSVADFLRDHPESTNSDIRKGTGITQTAIDKYFRIYSEAFSFRRLKKGERLDIKGKRRSARLWSLEDENKLPIMEVSASLGNDEVGELSDGTYLVGPKIQQSNDGVVGEDKAILLGYYLSEGCQFHPTEDKGIVITFGPHEMYLAEDAKARLERAFPESNVRITTPKSSSRVLVRDKEASKWFRKMGSHLSHEKRIHQDVFSWSQKELLHVLTGWLEGDGDFHAGTSRLRGSTVSENLAYQMCRIAELCGIKATVVLEPKKIGEVESIITHIRVDGVTYDQDVIARHHRWTLLISSGSTNKIFSNSRRWADQYHQTGRKRCEFAWWKNRRVHKLSKKVTRPYEGKVYNIEVEGDHSYVVDYGVATRNCEHVQVPELSKGKIIDAVARDLGDTIYIDILVATDRKHKQLIKDIESGKVNAMSMGCSIAYSRCSKCGNVAAEEEDLCDHIRHEKGNYFIDEQGIKRLISELCGHSSDKESVTFIEASWVANPAFKGAVLRQVLNGSKGFSEDARRAIAESLQRSVASSSMMAEFMAAQNHDAFNLTAANSHTLRAAAIAPAHKYAFGFDDEEDEEEDVDPLTQVKEDIKKKLRDDLKKELQQELEEELGFLPEEPMFTGPDNIEDVNENIITSAYHAFNARYAHELGPRTRQVFYALYASAWQAKHKTASFPDIPRADKVAAMYLRDRDFTMQPLAPEMYQCLASTHPLHTYASPKQFVLACQHVIGRGLTKQEAQTLISRNKMLG